jgi:hypothetical protein
VSFCRCGTWVRPPWAKAGANRSNCMPIDRSLPFSPTVWSRRTVEWSLMVALIVIVGTVFFDKANQVRGQAEAAAIQSVLGTLRVALVVDQVKAQSDSGTGRAPVRQRNPFALLPTPPANYFGETPANATAAHLPGPPGSWTFSAACDCIAYVPLNDQWFSSASGDTVAYFQIKDQGDGPLQLVKRETYYWRGIALD